MSDGAFCAPTKCLISPRGLKKLSIQFFNSLGFFRYLIMATDVPFLEESSARLMLTFIKNMGDVIGVVIYLKRPFVFSPKPSIPFCNLFRRGAP